MTATFPTLLAPIPAEHLKSGADIANEKGKVAFGSRNWELFRKLDDLRGGEVVEALFYESHSDQSGAPKATWRGVYINHVESRRGAHPEKMAYRPPTTEKYETDNKGHWAVFFEIAQLRRLDRSEWMPMTAFRPLDGETAYVSSFVPRGPLLVAVL